MNKQGRARGQGRAHRFGPRPSWEERAARAEQLLEAAVAREAAETETGDPFLRAAQAFSHDLKQRIVQRHEAEVAL